MTCLYSRATAFRLGRIRSYSAEGRAARIRFLRERLEVAAILDHDARPQVFLSPQEDRKNGTDTKGALFSTIDRGLNLGVKLSTRDLSGIRHISCTPCLFFVIV